MSDDSTAEMSDDSLHSCVLGTNFTPIRTPGEIMSFGVSRVIYSDSEEKLLAPYRISSDQLSVIRHTVSLIVELVGN